MKAHRRREERLPEVCRAGAFCQPAGRPIPFRAPTWDRQAGIREPRQAAKEAAGSFRFVGQAGDTLASLPLGLDPFAACLIRSLPGEVRAATAAPQQRPRRPIRARHGRLGWGAGDSPESEAAATLRSGAPWGSARTNQAGPPQTHRFADRRAPKRTPRGTTLPPPRTHKPRASGFPSLNRAPPPSAVAKRAPLGSVPLRYAARPSRHPLSPARSALPCPALGAPRPAACGSRSLGSCSPALPIPSVESSREVGSTPKLCPPSPPLLPPWRRPPQPQSSKTERRALRSLTSSEPEPLQCFARTGSQRASAPGKRKRLRVSPSPRATRRPPSLAATSGIRPWDWPQPGMSHFSSLPPPVPLAHVTPRAPLPAVSQPAEQVVGVELPLRRLSRKKVHLRRGGGVVAETAE